jgi:hypothetical protein
MVGRFDISYLCERLVVSSGISSHWRQGSWKAAWIWLVKVPGVFSRVQPLVKNLHMML